MSEEPLTAESAKSAKEEGWKSGKGLGSEHPGGLLSAICCSPGRFVAGLLALLFAGALFWAAGRDPFQRVWFTIKVHGQGKTECVAVVPKSSLKSKVSSLKSGGGRWPVVVYLHGSGGSLLGDGSELRQMAEMGLAVVGVEDGGKAESRKQKAEIVRPGAGGAEEATQDGFDEQFSALLNYVGRHRWADTNRMAWVGSSLGAQRVLSFALRHPDCQPKLLVLIAGGWVPELQSKIWSLTSKVQGPESKVPGPKSKVETVLPEPSTLNSQPSTALLLVHGERDEVFPLPEAQRVAACLRTNGVPVELKVLPGEGHGLGANRLLVLRVIGEQCLTRLAGPDALANYRSILSWQARAWPLWLFWTPALAWTTLWLWLRRKVGQASRLPPEEPLPRQDQGTQKPPGAVPLAATSYSPNMSLPSADLLPPSPRIAGRGKAEGCVQGGFCEAGNPEMGSRGRSPSREADGTPALRWLAAILAIAALAQTALHLVPPRLPVSERTLAIARKHLIAPKEKNDFEFLAAKPFWSGKRLRTLLEHVELAHYNRELINWKLDEQMYQQFVLSPEIDPAADGELNWRRPLWENFYPRIRREQSTEAAADIVIRFLRERVTIAEGSGLPAAVAEIWQRQITNKRGFEAVYVAAMRSVGVPSRLDPQGRAEFWAGSAWQAAPRPLVEGWN
ncbi:MAG: alpha/beta hydrolase family protein [Limisphaerales bacterium]